MKQRRELLLIFAILSISAVCVFAGNDGFTSSFGTCSFSSTGKNPYFILEPGFQQVYEGKQGKVSVRLTITVLDKTIVINGIETRVIKEREVHNGELVEVSRNYFAMCKRNNSVFYFGEDTDLYQNGMIVSHEGSWRAGVNGAQGGLVMPGIILLGAKYQQEVAPPVAMDRAEIIANDLTVSTPAGIFQNVVQTRETTPLEPGNVEYKWYAAKVGLIQDETLKLVSYTMP